MSFAFDLALRFRDSEVFRTNFDRLQAEAARATLSGGLAEKGGDALSGREVLALLYCASVFAQTDDEPLRALAQAIALAALLAKREDVPVDASLRLLTDLGNFPALTYAEERYPSIDSFRQTVRAAVSRELNGIDVGSERIALTDFQKRAWDLLASSEALAVSAPTSAGKSFLVIEHLCRSAESQSPYCAVYVAPTRALLSEVYASVQRRLATSEHVRVTTVPTIDPTNPDQQVFILTQERLQVLLAVSNIEFDLIVVDEAQNLSDGARGMILQECLEQAVARKDKTRVIFLAPGAEGFDDVAQAVGIKKLQPSVSLLPSVIQNRILVSKAAEPRSLKLRLLTALGSVALGTLQSQRGFDLPANRLAAVALELGRTGGSLVYATGPKDAENVALQLFQDCKDQDNNQLRDLAEFIEKHKGIDVYFENVGGSHLDAALPRMNVRGRIPVCGMISMYNGGGEGVHNLFSLIYGRIRMEGFVASDFGHLNGDFLRDMTAWVKSGQIKYEETVLEGFDRAPEGLIGLFKGENLGKMLIHIAD